MARSTFLYYLFSENNRALYVGANGKIYESDEDWKRTDGQPANLEYSPIGWKEALVKYGRNIKYWGMFRDMTVPMTFPGDGFEILLDRIRKHGGYEALVSMGMLKLDRTILPYTYRSWFLSELNCVKAQQFLDSIKIEALEGGLSKFLKANENTKYTIPIDDDPEHITVYNDGMELLNNATWSVTDGIPTIGDVGYYVGNHLIDMSVVAKEIQDIGGVYTIARTKVNNSGVAATKKMIYKATTDRTLKVEYDFILTVTVSSGNALNPAAVLRSQLRRLKADGTIYSPAEGQGIQMLQVAGTAFIPGAHIVKGTADLAVKAGDEVYAYTFVSPEGATGDVICAFNYSGDEPHIKIDYSYRHPASFVNGHLPKRWAQLIVDAMTGTKGMYKIESKFLDKLEKEFVLVFVSGDSLRGVKGATGQTSLMDLYKSLNSRFGIGLGIKNGDTLILEKWEDLFNDTEIIFDLGEVDFKSVDEAEDLLFNTIRNGYNKQDYQEINGRSEINQGQQWVAPPVKISKELDLLAVYRGDAMGAELMRINFGQKTTTDSKSDNEVWMLHVKKSNRVPRFEANTRTVTNYVTGTANIKFTTTSGSNLMKPNGDKNEFTYVGVASVFVKVSLGVVPKKSDNSRSRFRIYRNGDVVAEGFGLSNGAFQTTIEGSFIINPNDVITGEIAYFGEGIVSPVSISFANFYFDFVGLNVYELNRPNYTTITGVLAPGSIYNMELSPKRGILDNGSFIRSCLEQMDNKFITLSSADKNTEVTTTLNGVTITENAPLPIGSLTAPKFSPEYINFRTKVPINLLERMDVMPYGKIKFTIIKRVYYGWLMDGGLKPGTMDAQDWKVLNHWSNDLSKIRK